jgi:hypothetical protein
MTGRTPVAPGDSTSCPRWCQDLRVKRSQNFEKFFGDLIDRAIGVDDGEQASGIQPLQQDRRLSLEGDEALANAWGGVVGTGSRREPLCGDVVGYREHDRRIETFRAEPPEERVELVGVSGEPIEQEPAPAHIGLPEARLHEPVDEHIGNQAPGVHAVLDTPSEWRPEPDRLAQQVTSRDVRNRELSRQTQRLGSLAGSWRPGDEQPHLVSVPVDARRADGALCSRDHLKLLESPPSPAVLLEVCLRLPGGHPHGGGERTHVVDKVCAFGHEYSVNVGVGCAVWRPGKMRR